MSYKIAMAQAIQMSMRKEAQATVQTNLQPVRRRLNGKQRTGVLVKKPLVKHDIDMKKKPSAAPSQPKLSANEL